MSEAARRRLFALTVAAAFLAGLGLRLVPLHWSPLPATLDGFQYADLAATVRSSAPLLGSEILSDELVFTMSLAALSAVVGEAPLVVAQPMAAAVGAATPLAAGALAARTGWELGWPARRVRLAAALAALGIAVEGLYLRRTGVPDEEAVGLLFVPLLALAVHRTLVTGRARWAAVTGLFAAAFPLLHNLSTVAALLTATGVVALRVGRSPRRGVALAAGLVIAFWAYFFAYYGFADRLGLDNTYQTLLGDYPGLFAAWVVLFVAGVRWFRSTTDGVRRLAYLSPVCLGVALAAVNAVHPVFPGTVLSPPLVVALLSIYLVPVWLAALTLDRIERAPTAGVAASVLLAPFALVYYGVTASMNPAFFGAVIRVQSFAHPAVFAFAGLAVAVFLDSGALADARTRLSDARASESDGGVDRGRLRTVVAVVFVLCLLGTVPLGYVELDTATYPSTTTRSEFQAATFAATHTRGAFATGDPVSRVAHYYHDDAGASKAPTRAWLASDGDPPSCPVVSRASWTRAGAHLYPAAPETLSEARHRALLMRHNLIYSSNGLDPVYVTVPPGDDDDAC